MVNTSKDKNIFIIVNSPVTSKVLSGSDKIFIKIAEEINKFDDYAIHLLVCPEAKILFQNVLKPNKKINYVLINNIWGEKLNFLILTYFLRILTSIKVFFISIPKNSVIISSSDFLTDFFPLLVIFLKYRNGNKYFSSMFMRKEKSIKENLNDFFYRKSQEFNLFCSKFFNFKIFCNPIDKEYLFKKGIKKENIITLVGGIDIYEIIIPKEKKYTACFVGRINKVKGIPRMLKIWKKFIYKNPSATLAMISSGTKIQEEELLELLKKERLLNNVKLLGFLDNKDKYEVLANSSMFLLPSYYESFGIVILEAFSMKLPVICFDVLSLRFNFDKRLIFSKDEEDFLKNISKIFENKDQFKLITESNYKFSLNFTWKNTVRKFLTDLV